MHGHSSHHPRPVEVYRGRLILYGCGDLIDDYEGISGYEEYRPDLRLLYLAALDPADGRLVELRMMPFLARRMRLRHARRRRRLAARTSRGARARTWSTACSSSAADGQRARRRPTRRRPRHTSPPRPGSAGVISP